MRNSKKMNGFFGGTNARISLARISLNPSCGKSLKEGEMRKLLLEKLKPTWSGNLFASPTNTYIHPHPKMTSSNGFPSCGITALRHVWSTGPTLFMFQENMEFLVKKKTEKEEIQKNFYKIKIPKKADLLKDALYELDRMNINCSTLFPGLDGFAKHLETLSFYIGRSERPLLPIENIFSDGIRWSKVFKTFQVYSTTNFCLTLGESDFLTGT